MKYQVVEVALKGKEALWETYCNPEALEDVFFFHEREGLCVSKEFNRAVRNLLIENAVREFRALEYQGGLPALNRRLKFIGGKIKKSSNPHWDYELHSPLYDDAANDIDFLIECYLGETLCPENLETLCKALCWGFYSVEDADGYPLAGVVTYGFDVCPYEQALISETLSSLSRGVGYEIVSETGEWEDFELTRSEAENELQNLLLEASPDEYIDFAPEPWSGPVNQACLFGDLAV